MSRPLPIIHRVTEHDAGPYRMGGSTSSSAMASAASTSACTGAGHGAVAVVPMLDADTVLLVREYAAGVHRPNWAW